MTNEIQKTEAEIFALVQKLETLRKATAPVEVKQYEFQTLDGKVSLLDLFGEKDTLFAIHNMGQGCVYCTLWADGLNGLLPHLEDKFSVVLLSKDSPAAQRQFANSRQWRFRMASHGGGAYMTEQSVGKNGGNNPGVVCYKREGNRVFIKNRTPFGPGDLFCAQWHLLSLAGVGMEDWSAEYNYWKKS